MAEVSTIEAIKELKRLRECIGMEHSQQVFDKTISNMEKFEKIERLLEPSSPYTYRDIGKEVEHIVNGED